jgi:hypothetical protein
MHDEEICPSCLRDEISALDEQLVELDKFVNVLSNMLLLLGVTLLYLLLK